MSESFSGKIGIMGGTFDPIHIGHLFLAEEAYSRIGLDKVLIMPSPAPYHRTDKAVTDVRHRINMIKLAIADNPHLEYSDFELTHPGAGYSADTLEAFKAENPGAEIYFIIGGDSLFSIENWKDPERVFKNAVILASKRENEEEGASGSCAANTACSGNDFKAQAEYLRKKYGAAIIDLETPTIGVSSSSIIKKIREGKTIKYHTADSVIEYIQSNRLYIES